MQNKEKIAVGLKDLKEELYRRKEEIADIKELVKSEIDRDYQIDPWELSPRELDSRMGSSLSFLNDDIDTRPEPGIITSHRKIVGKPIVFVKRLFMKLAGFYTNSILEKQRRFNDQLVAFHLASFIRFKHNEKKMQALEERIKDFEDNQEFLLDELKNIRQRIDIKQETLAGEKENGK